MIVHLVTKKFWGKIFRKIGRGQGRVSNFFASFVKQDEIVFKTDQGYKWHLNPSHGGDLQRIWDVWEPDLKEYFIKNTEEGMKILDIGAHRGTYALLTASIVGPTGRVFAFEPDARTRGYLERSVVTNSFNQLEVYPFAVGDKTETANMTQCAPHIDSKGDFEIEVRRADELVQGHVDIVKIDTDGLEGKVISSLKGVLIKGSKLIVEASNFDYQPISQSIREIDKAASELGMKLVGRIGQGGEIVPFEGAEGCSEAHLVYQL